MGPAERTGSEGGAAAQPGSIEPPLLAEALEAAGGEGRWRRVRRISARVRSGGLLPRTRVPGNRFADYRVTVEAGSQRSVLDPYPRPGRRGVLDAAGVRIESDSGDVLERRRDPRARFSGLSGLRRNLRWDALDATYFAGYAMWNYLLTPLLLTRDEVTVREGAGWAGEGESWRRLDADFAGSLATHSPRQSFFFDAAGLLVRHDYTAEVVGPWAHAAHYCSAHRSFDGLVLPTSRRALPRRRNLRSRSFPTLVWLEIGDVAVDFS